MRKALLVALVFTVGVVGLQAGQDQGEAPRITLPLLLGRAAWYVDDFITNFANVVTEETYVQDASSPTRPAAALRGRGSTRMSSATLDGGTTHRRLRSDFLLVSLQGTFDWVPFRDVFEVDAVPVRDRQERLTNLFLKPAPSNLQQAERISAESTRYNLGNMQRTINNPILGMAILQAYMQDRFNFVLGGKDPSVGPDVWVVQYRERASPTMVLGRSNLDLFAHGRVWLDESGRLLKSEIGLDQPSLQARVVTTYRYDERFKIAVPTEMREEYTGSVGTVTAVATYDRFRHFGVTTEQSFDNPVSAPSPDPTPSPDPSPSPER